MRKFKSLILLECLYILREPTSKFFLVSVIMFIFTLSVRSSDTLFFLPMNNYAHLNLWRIFLVWIFIRFDSIVGVSPGFKHYTDQLVHCFWDMTGHSMVFTGTEYFLQSITQTNCSFVDNAQFFFINMHFLLLSTSHHGFKTSLILGLMIA